MPSHRPGLCRNVLLIGIVTHLWSAHVQAQPYVTQLGYVEFVSKAATETFTGTSKSLQGFIDLESRKLDFYVDLNTLRTGIALRDEHMRESYLETDKYPFAEFTGLINGYNPSRTDTQNVIVVGDFSLHGVTKPRTIQGRMYVAPDHVYVEASWVVKLSDHAIAIPRVLFLKLAEEQQVRMQAQLRRKE